MPPRHRRDMLGVLFAAVLSSVYFVTLGLLLQPLPSRTLPPRMLVPDFTASRSSLPPANAAAPVDTPVRPAQTRTTRPVKGVPRSAVVAASAIDRPAASGAPSSGRRPRFFGRVFRGVLRGVQLADPKPQAP